MSSTIQPRQARPAPTSPRSAAMRLGLVVLQLVLFAALAWAFQVESPAFYRVIVPLALGGAVFNHCLPQRARLAFFSGLGIAGILILFGVVAGLWMIALGVLLIALCHL